MNQVHNATMTLTKALVKALNAAFLWFMMKPLIEIQLPRGVMFSIIIGIATKQHDFTVQLDIQQ